MSPKLKEDADKLRAARLKLNHSQESIAKVFGISFRQYNRYERGVSPIPQLLWMALKVVRTRGKE